MAVCAVFKLELSPRDAPAVIRFIPRQGTTGRWRSFTPGIGSDDRGNGSRRKTPMPKWTRDWNDERHSVRVRVELFEAIRWGMNLRVTLKDGRSVDGLWLSSKFENNGGGDGAWSYCSSLSLRTEDWDLELDFLDIERICPACLSRPEKTIPR